MWGWIKPIFEALVGPVFEFFRSWREQRTARNLGRNEQAAADAKAGLKEAAYANRARSNVGSGDADVDRLLRRPGARD